MLASLIAAALPLAAPGLAAPAPASPPAVASPAAVPSPPTACNSLPQTNEIQNPPEIRSTNGVLTVTLYLRGDPNPDAEEGMCWWHDVVAGQHSSAQAWIPPTLHLRQGDELRLTLVNQMFRAPTHPPLVAIDSSQADEMDGMADTKRAEDYTLMCGQPQLTPTPTPDPVTGRIYGYHRTPWNDTNMHFHGLNVSPKRPSDDVVGVMLCPRRQASEPPKTYTYVLDIPLDEPPGTYWYHPHAHGESEHQVLSQLTGAIIIDPLQPAIPQQLFNRVIVVRDLGSDGQLPDARTVQAVRRIRALSPPLAAIRASFLAHGPPPMDYAPPPFRFGTPNACPDLDAARPSQKHLRVNTVLVPPQSGHLKLLPWTTIAQGAVEYWRFANTTADTILDVEMFVNGRRVAIPVTSRDGVPLVVVHGVPTWQPVAMDHVRLSPASRMEFYLYGATPGDIVLHTQTIDSGCLGDHAYARNLLVVHVKPSGHAVKQPLVVPRAVPVARMRFSDLAEAQPTKHRYFVFTEYNRQDELEPDRYITELSNPHAVEHPFASSGPPDVIVKSGTVEDWTILNYTQELHEFHIHQIHFLVVRGHGIDFGEHQMLDTVDVPYGSFASGSSGQFIPGAVTLRMDFRDPNIIGDFVYHCHILSHEDNGMMARIRVAP